MEGLGINAVIAIAGIIGAAAVMRYMVSEMKRHIEAVFKRLDKHGDDLVALNTKSEMAVTMTDVAEEFLRKEMFVQFRSHTDEKFKDLKADMDKQYKLLEKVYDSVGGKNG